MSRDIDQEVSDTLCTLLSFDEDNFLSQEEVEENLRNCPNIEQVNYSNVNISEAGVKDCFDPDDKKENFQERNEDTSVSQDIAQEQESPTIEYQNTFINETEAGIHSKGVMHNPKVDEEEDTEGKLFKQPTDIKMEFICESEQFTEGHLEPSRKIVGEDKEYNLNEHDFKMEFVSETEQISEHHLVGEYSIEDQFKKDINFNDGLMQVEVSSLDESLEKIENVYPKHELLDNILLNQDSAYSPDEELIINGDEDGELSSVMNDHNYTSQEKETNVENLHKILVTHILKKGPPSMSIKNVYEFVEKTLDSINTFSTDSGHQKKYAEVNLGESGVLIDIFDEGKSSKTAVFDDRLKGISTNHCAFEKKTTNKENTSDPPPDYDLSKTGNECSNTICGKDGLNIDDLVKNISISSIASPKENCSEPLEHAICEISSQKSKSMNDFSIKNAQQTPEASTEHFSPDEADKATLNDVDTEIRNTSNEDESQEHCSDTLEVTKCNENSSEEKKDRQTELPTFQGDEIVTDGHTKTTISNEELPKITEQYFDEDKEEMNTTEEFPANEATSENTAASVTAEENIVQKVESCADSKDFKSINLSSIPSPRENCSEPMEHATFDEAFDLNCKEKSTVIKHLDTLMSFAKSLQNDCETFTSSTTSIENKLRKYLQQQFEIFKKIIQPYHEFRCVEKSIQTDPRLSKRKMRKLNQNNKKILLDPSDSSSSSDTSSSETSMKSQIFQARAKSSGNKSQTDSATQIFKAKNESIAAEYDDGVALGDYTQSEIFETEAFCDSFSNIRKLNKNDSVSDDDVSEREVEDTEDRKNAKPSSPAEQNGSQNESDKENSVHKNFDSNKNPQDEGDKEIERLINLNGLIKRPNMGIAKSNEKVKTKSSSGKNKDLADTYINDDIQQDIFSDASISESEEEIITETQFLKRCNENMKQQLLTDSNSEFSESDVSDDIEEILSSNEGSSSPLVERFLKRFNASESEDETEKCDKIKSLVGQEAVDSKNNSMERNSSIEKIKSNSSENSDCEMLDDMVSSTKHSKQKSLEKMLSVVEKRKKMNRLCDSISLSSESESSDVEAVEDSKSRIKPMLRPEQLATVTREAQRNETERIRRLEKKHKMLSKLLKERPDVQEDCNLILDYNDETKTFIKVHPDIVKHLKQHQRDGVKFMYDSCYGGVEALKKSAGSGCILAHCMGLGKTLQLIALLHTVISYKELKTSKVLVLCPKSTVMNWADEIERWLGPLKPKYYTFNDTSDINDKIQILKEWSLSTANAAGILLIGYEAFRTLVFYHSYKNRGIAPSRLESIRSDVDKYLLSPGADLVVCDEGHIIKNSKSAISLAVSQIKTQKRIVLTGTPIQNNLKEYYSMVNFIKPLFLGTEKEFANLYANPIKNGQHKDSSKRDIQVMKQRSFVLHKKLSKFVQRKEAELLKTFLPQKYEYVLFIPMTKVQTILYEYILNIISKKEDRGKGLITDYTCLRKIWTHPKVLEDAWKNATAQKHKKDPRKNQAVNSDDDQPDDVYDSQTGVISVTNDWWRSLLAEKDLETILPSNKLRTMFEILRMCEEKGEKCLIFSAFVAVLNVVEYFFKKMSDRDPDTLNELKMSQGYQVKNTWILGKDYYRLDGKTPKLIRHAMIEQFNSLSNKRARVFLISSRAGGQGINLTGANRVIILDTSWNPSNDQQNIFRVFRLGQKKNCYIYRLIAMGTMEEKVYSRSVTKQAMSFRVVDEQQIDRHYSMAELTELYSLTIPDYENRPMPDCPQDSILASLILNYPQLVYKYHEHDSLLENKVEQELSEQEKQDAWAAYERDQQLNSEIREMPNPDDLQNNVAAPKFPPYLGSSLSAFNQMSALFNYGNYTPGALSSYLPYLSHLGNYTASSQQYLEMRKRIAEGAFAYPDINTPLSSAAFTSPFAQNPPKSVPSNPLIPDLPMHSNAMHPNPLSALGDLSMYALNAANNHMSHNMNTPTLPPRQHSSPTYPASSPSPANNIPANFDYQMYENSLKSLVNYRHDFAGNGNSLNKSKASTMPMNQFRNPIYPSAANANFDRNALSTLNSSSPKTVEQQQPQKQHSDRPPSKSSSDISVSTNGSTRNDTSTNKSNFTVNNTNAARSSPLPQSGSKRPFSSDVSTNLVEDRLTPNSKSSKDPQLSGVSSLQSYNSNNAASSGSIFSSKSTGGKTASDNISHSSGMQIIPTTSPPGTTSATKQFSEISPSISLTALGGTSTSSSGSKSNFNQSKNQTKNPSNKPATSTNPGTELASSSSSSFAAGKFFEMSKKSESRYASAKPTLPTAKTKSSSSSESVLRSATPTPKQNSYQQSTSDLGTKLLSSITAKSKNIVHKKPQNLSMQQPKTNTQARQSTVTTVKGQNGTPKPSTSKLVTQIQQSDAKKTAISAMEKRLSPIITSQSLGGQTQKPPTSSSTLKIQPSQMKQSSSSSNENMLTYILETCINQKKLAIGAPTKSGGGTTVTRVQTPAKRKHSDNLSKDTVSSESKRAK